MNPHSVCPSSTPRLTPVHSRLRTPDYDNSENHTRNDRRDSLSPAPFGPMPKSTHVCMHAR
ncbi:hypothetical protein PSPO01_07416 [Paraphaeosphaeria sporulosa]